MHWFKVGFYCHLFPGWFLLARTFQGGVEGKELCDQGGEGSSIQSEKVYITDRLKCNYSLEYGILYLLHVTIFSPVLGSTIETWGHSVIG